MPTQAMRTKTITPSERVENGLFLAVANLIWAYDFRLPLGKDGKESSMDLSDEAFLNGAIRIPKPYEVRIIPRNPERLALVISTWKRAKEEGYVMRGLTLTESEGIAVNEKLKLDRTKDRTLNAFQEDVRLLCTGVLYCSYQVPT